MRFMTTFFDHFFVERRNSMGLTDDEIVNVSCYYCPSIIPMCVPKEKNSAVRKMVSSFFATMHSGSLLKDSKKRPHFILTLALRHAAFEATFFT